jgi:hypothetical protein
MIGDQISQNNFERKYSSFFAKIESIQKLITYSVETTEQIEFRSVDDKVIYTFFRQVVESFNAIFILLGNGYSRNSMILLRSMYEHCVTMKYLNYLLENPIEASDKAPYPDNVEKFLDFYFVNKRKHINKLQEVYPKEFREEKIKTVENEFNLVKQKFEVNDCKTCGTKRFNHQWSPNSIVAMAKKVDLDDKLTFYCYFWKP